MPTYRNLLIHTLAFDAGAATLEDLEAMAKRAVALGASGLELLFHPMPVHPAKDVASVFRKTGCTKASLCIFLPGDGSLGDPLNPAAFPKGKAKTFELIQKGTRYVQELRSAGIEIDVIDGPFCYLLGKQDYPPGALKELVSFMEFVSRYAGDEGVRLALELLQESEDGVIRRAKVLAQLIHEIDSPAFGGHLDTFHLVKNGDQPAEAIKLIGPRLFHFHANGIGADRATEGRIPCGCRNYQYHGSRQSYTDTIDWAGIRVALQDSGAELDKLLICLEPFSEKACQAIPPLRNGVVPFTDDSQLVESVKNLAAAGLLVE